MAETSAAATETDTVAPLLRPRQEAGRPTTLALLLGRATGRRGASMLVRETAAQQLEERRADWGYSRPVVALDMMWNMAFVVVSVVVLFCSMNENPNVPIRIWICGYALQCSVHVVLVWLEYSRRNRRRFRRDEESAVAVAVRPDSNLDSNETDDDDDTVGALGITNRARLAVVFLAFDVFFAVFCVVLACLIGIALCCCLPCIIAILYAVAGQEGASDAELSILPKYRFQTYSNEEKTGIGAGRMVPVETSSEYLANERILLPEDAECCICLNPYEDGAELHALPCNHHFHSSCIVRWLKMNATCPLCKYNILKGNE
ncbi:hypothetical protein ACSBR2_039568 [Camellia fascicularis]